MKTGQSLSEMSKPMALLKIHAALTQTANMKGKAESEDNWSKDREEKHPGSEEDGAARPTASLRKLRSQDQVVASRHTKFC